MAGGFLFGLDSKEWGVMTLFLKPQGLEYSAESTSLSGSEPVVGFERVAFVPLSAAHTPPPPRFFLSLGLAHQGLLVLMLGCDVPLLGEHGSRTEQSH